MGELPQDLAAGGARSMREADAPVCAAICQRHDRDIVRACKIDCESRNDRRAKTRAYQTKQCFQACRPDIACEHARTIGSAAQA